MNVKAKLKQPSPDEILNEFFKTNSPSDLFVDGDVNCLTENGKAVLAIGIQVYKSFYKANKK